jgi:predicted dehydrogenase
MASRCGTDYQAALQDPAVEAVDICLPHREHAAVAVAAAAAGKPILCEKPLAARLAAADQMIAAADAAGVVLLVAENVRFDPVLLKVDELLHAGVIGTPALVQRTRVLSAGVVPQRAPLVSRRTSGGRRDHAGGRGA